MPYGVTAAQGVLGAGTPPPRNSDASKPSSSFKVPGFGGGGGDGGSSNNSKNSKANHFRGDARATSSSSSFTGVMQALLKPTRGSASAAAAAKAESPERPQPTFRPRSALDLSGHSFSKTMKAEINRSKVALKTGGANGGGGGGGGGIPRHDWWDRSGGLGMDDSLARPTSTRSVAAYAADPARSTHLRMAPRAPKSAESGDGALQHQQQHQQHQQARSMCRPRSHGDAILDELSRAVGLQ